MTITDRIRKQLEQPDGLTHEALEPLAIEYAQAATDVNQRLSDCIALLRKGLRSEAIQRASMKPNVLDLSADLDFGELQEWIEILQFYGISAPPILDRDAAAQLHEALVEEQPIEELLSQHRRLAIAKAPLGWRLKVLRAISKLDPLNPVWEEDIRQWETIRLKQIQSEWGEADRAGNLEHLKSISEELNSAAWIVLPPADLKIRVANATHKREHASQVQSLRQLATTLHDAYIEGNEYSAIEASQQWERAIAGMKAPPPTELTDEVAPALEWVSDRLSEREQIEKHERALEKLEGLLQKNGVPEQELSRAYHNILGLQLGIDPLLETRFKTRISEIQQSARRRAVLTVAGIVAATLAIMVTGGLWYWNHNYRLAVANTSAKLNQLLTDEKFNEAESILGNLKTQAPAVANAPEVAAISSSLKAKLDEESKRAAMVAKLIEAADAADPSELDTTRIIAAEKAAKTDEEKLAISSIRARFQKYEQGLADTEYSLIRVAIEEIDQRVQQFQNKSIQETDDADLDSVLVDLRGLSSKYPKAASQASKLLDLSIQRATSVRDSIRKQRREMEQRQVSLLGVRKATSSQELENQLKKYVESLPIDPISKEFKEALNESGGWKKMDAWNTWCNDFAVKYVAGLQPQDLMDQVKRMDSIRASINGLPNMQSADRLRQHAEFAQKRGEVLDSLREDFDESVIMELISLQTSVGKPLRNFMNHESYLEYAEMVGKLNPNSKSTLPVVSDVNGAVTNKDFKGKIEVVDEPRTTLRVLVRTLQNKRDSILADWDNQLLTLLRNIVENNKLDGKVKEMIFARILSAAREGSASIEASFGGVQDVLFATSAQRGRWFLESEINFEMSDELKSAFEKSSKDFRILKDKQNAEFIALSKSKMVWVGELLRDSTGAVSASLYREDVPDGQLYTIVGIPGKNDNWRLVVVGSVSNREGVLESAVENLLPGRPLFWMRAPASSPAASRNGK